VDSMDQDQFVNHMHTYTAACWASTDLQFPPADTMAPIYGWKVPNSSSSVVNAANTDQVKPDIFSEDLNRRLKKAFLRNLCRRPAVGLTEVRRDGKDTDSVARVITKEFNRCVDSMDQDQFVNHMHTYTAACWATMESVHQQTLEDDQPENERSRLDPDHWYENNLTNASLFANLYLEGVHGLEQLVPGRLFTTRMPRNIVEDPGERKDFVDKCKKNQLKVIFVLTEPFEFKKYSGMDGLLEFYTGECGLIVYNRAIPDFQIPTSGDLVNNILDLTYHLSQGRNCLIHCAGGTGRTGMVVAAIVQNLGVYDTVSRIRKVKSTYVETKDQEIFLKNMPKVIDRRIIEEKPHLARAIAAEHLIQVFHTHGSSIEKANDKDVARDNLGDIVEPLDQEEEDALLEAYGQTFDLIDQDGSGTLDREELDQWFAMCGAEIDLTQLTEVLVGEKCLTRERFAKLMSSSAKTNRRDYDIGSG